MTTRRPLDAPRPSTGGPVRAVTAHRAPKVAGSVLAAFARPSGVRAEVGGPTVAFWGLSAGVHISMRGSPQRFEGETVRGRSGSYSYRGVCTEAIGKRSPYGGLKLVRRALRGTPRGRSQTAGASSSPRPPADLVQGELRKRFRSKYLTLPEGLRFGDRAALCRGAADVGLGPASSEPLEPAPVCGGARRHRQVPRAGCFVVGCCRTLGAM